MFISKKLRNGSLVIASFALAAGSLTACSSQGKPETDSKAESGDVIEIQYVHRLPDDEGMTKVSDIVERWNKDNPKIQVKATKFDGAAGDLIQKLETDVKAKNAPCLAQVGYAEIPETYVKGILEDVTSEAAKYSDDFISGAFNLMGVDGKTFGLPQDVGPLVYYYNTEAFKQLGIELPQTADELLAAAQKASAAGKYILSFQPDEAANMLSGLAGAASDPWFTVKDGKWNVNTLGTGTTAVADVWQKLLDAKAVTVTPRWDDAWSAQVADGTLIGTIGAAWEGALIANVAKNSADYAGKWAVAELPNWFGNEGMTGPDGGSGVAVIKGCAHRAEAMEFNDWFNTQVEDLATQGLVLATSKGIPSTPESYASFFAGGQDPMQVFSAAAKHLNDKFIYMPGWSAVGAAMGEPATAASMGKGKVTDIFSVAGETAVKTLKDLGLPVQE